MSSPGLPSARCPMAQHGWLPGGFFAWIISPGTRAQPPYSKPTDKRGRRSTVHLQHIQPTRARSVNLVHGGLPSPTTWHWGPNLCVSTYHCVSGGQSLPPGRDFDVDSSGISAEIHLLERDSHQMMLMFLNITHNKLTKQMSVYFFFV